MNNLPWQRESVIKQSQLILNSFEHWFKHSLFEEKGLRNSKGSPQEYLNNHLTELVIDTKLFAIH